jgi:hypothetical protein
MIRILRLKFAVIKFSMIILFILLQGYLIFLKKHDTLDIDARPNSQPTANIHSYHKIGQTFIARRDNLCGVDLMLGTHGRDNDKEIIFQLWQNTPEKKLVAQQEFNASDVVNNLYNPVRFLPIQHSEDQEYYFHLYSPESTPDNSICLWMNSDNIYDEGHLMLNGKPHLGDLVFRVYSKRPVYTEIGRIVRNYTGVFGNKYILMLIMVLFVSVQIVVLHKILDYMYGIFRQF